VAYTPAPRPVPRLPRRDPAADERAAELIALPVHPPGRQRDEGGPRHRDRHREIDHVRPRGQTPAAVGRDPDGHRQRWVAILAVLDATNGDAGSAMPSWC
jgi:hypothetical protein